MDLAWISVFALLIVIVLSCTNLVHPGFLAIALAWFIGVYLDHLGSRPIGLRGVLSGFPVDLFLTLTGVGLFFAQAQQNGTLDRIAHAGVVACRGNVGLIPWMFFLLTALLAVVGAGNIASAALMAPMAMSVAQRAGIPAALMTVVVGHGAVAGALSPISPTGIIARDALDKLGVTGFEMPIFWYNLAANLVAALGGFFLFGGVKLFRRSYRPGAGDENGREDSKHFETKHWLTLTLIALLLVGVVFFRMHVGMAAFAGAVLLTLCRLADDHEAVRKMPWSVILMVCGVTVLTALLEKTGGTDRFGDMIVAISTPTTLPGVFTLVAGIVSVYSSTSGVVLPAFLPMIRPVLEKMDGDPVALACSIIVGGHLVDTSPLSTIGALCIASAGGGEDKQTLFVQVLLWGLAMAVVGAAMSLVFFGLWWSA